MCAWVCVWGGGGRIRIKEGKEWNRGNAAEPLSLGGNCRGRGGQAGTRQAIRRLWRRSVIYGGQGLTRIGAA